MRTPIVILLLSGFSIFYDVEAYPAKHEPADNSVYNSQHCIQMTRENDEKIGAIVTKLSEYLYNLTMEYEVFDIRLLKIIIEGHSDDEVEEKDTQVQLVVNDCAQINESNDAKELQETIGKEDPYEKEENIEIEFTDQAGDSNKSYATQTANKNDKTKVTNVADDSNNSQSVVTDDNATQADDENNGATVNNKSAGYNAEENNASNSASEKQNIVNQNTANVEQSEAYSTNDDSETSEIDVNNIQPSSDADFEVKGPVLVRLDLDKEGNKLIKATQVKRGEHVPLIVYIRKLLGNVEYLFGN